MRDLLEINPIIASVKNDEAIEKVIKSDCEIVFLLSGDIVTLKNKIQYLQNHETIFQLKILMLLQHKSLLYFLL